jgi:hypothetical protein
MVINLSGINAILSIFALKVHNEIAGDQAQKSRLILRLTDSEICLLNR